MSERHITGSLREIKEMLVLMCHHVEESLGLSIAGLEKKSTLMRDQVFEKEKDINRFHLDVDDSCVKALALHQPMANDLRFIVSSIKINSDLERIGDQSINIVKNADFVILHQSTLSPNLKSMEQHIPEMALKSSQMLKLAVDAFLKKDEAQARSVLPLDDRVDELKVIVFDEIISAIQVDPKCAHAGIALLLIARNLERVADHATNIAEEIVFAISGEDLRHSTL